MSSSNFMWTWDALRGVADAATGEFWTPNEYLDGPRDLNFHLSKRDLESLAALSGPKVNWSYSWPATWRSRLWLQWHYPSDYESSVGDEFPQERRDRWGPFNGADTCGPFWGIDNRPVLATFSIHWAGFEYLLMPVLGGWRPTWDRDRALGQEILLAGHAEDPSRAILDKALAWVVDCRPISVAGSQRGIDWLSADFETSGPSNWARGEELPLSSRRRCWEADSGMPANIQWAPGTWPGARGSDPLPTVLSQPHVWEIVSRRAGFVLAAIFVEAGWWAMRHFSADINVYLSSLPARIAREALEERDEDDWLNDMGEEGVLESLRANNCDAGGAKGCRRDFPFVDPRNGPLRN